MGAGEILERVFRIRFRGRGATAFALETGEAQYLVTSKQLFACVGFPIWTAVEVLEGNCYTLHNVLIQYPQNAKIDISVMRVKPFCRFAGKIPFRLSSEGLDDGQMVQIFGYPHDIDQLTAAFPKCNAAQPFRKTALISGMLRPAPALFVLDGSHDPGFSGAPVCFQRPGEDELSVAGVLSDVHHVINPVIDARSDHETDFRVLDHGGSIVVFDIAFALEVIAHWDEWPRLEK